MIRLGTMLTQTLLQTVTGRFREGRVHLATLPEGVEEAEVIVTFLPPNGSSRATTGEPASPPPAGKMMYAGMWAGGEEPTEEDFRDAEYRPRDIDV